MVAPAALRPLPFVPPRSSWSARASVRGIPVSIRILTTPSESTRVEVLRGSQVLSRKEDDLGFDGSRPRLWVYGQQVVLAYAAFPGAGSGAYASLWNIGRHGRRLRHLGIFRNADLRRWPTVREIRPTKDATDDILRAFPKAFDEERYRAARFVVAYRYDRNAKRLRLVSVRLANRAEAADWPYAVRFPSPRALH